MTGFEETILPVLISVAVFGFVIYRQLRPRKLSQKGLIILPAIILFFLIKSFSAFHPTEKEIIETLLMSIISIVLGLLACRQLHVYKGPTDRAMVKGNWTYILWWFAAFVIKAVLSYIFGETSLKGVSQTEIFIPVFFLMTARSAYLYWKTKQMGLILH
ncbi:MAG TPA: hypothetical protein VLF93_07385 [Candidatus Saccharimonadales bacterium]|nr:hypothetical protein [Candidatus Saccharimonadales bacterium]